MVGYPVRAPVRLRISILAAVGALLAVTIALMAVLSQSTRHSHASNFVPPHAFVADVPAGDRVCQPGERIPAGTGAIRARIGTYGSQGPRLELSISHPGGRRIAESVLAAGWRQGDVVIPVARLGALDEAEVCLRNAGSRRIAVAGGRTLGSGALVDGQAAAGGITLAYLEPEARSWFSFAPDVAERVDRLRDAPPGALTLPLFAALAVAVIAGAVALVLREERR